MKDNDTQLLGEAYTQVQEGFGDFAKSAAKITGKTAGKVGLAATGVAGTAVSFLPLEAVFLVAVVFTIYNITIDLYLSVFFVNIYY